MPQSPTFAGFPVCEALEKLNADIAIIGIPYGTPYDASHPPHCLNAPGEIRAESVRYPDDPLAWDFDSGDTLLGRSGARVMDCGDLPGSQADPAGNRSRARDAISKILKAGALPLVLGGDDSIPIPVMEAFADEDPFYVLQLDAHIDWRNHVGGVREGYSSTMRRASEMPWVKGITQVGMRGVGSAREQEYHDALDYGANLVTAAELRREGIEAALRHIPHGSRCFVTMDFDALDPSIMPAVGAPTPGGLSYPEVIDLIHTLETHAHLIGFALVELVPEADIRNLGTITAMRIAWNALAALARSLD